MNFPAEPVRPAPASSPNELIVTPAGELDKIRAITKRVGHIRDPAVVALSDIPVQRTAKV